MMPAGVYYVGDLCYVMTDDEWDEFCSLTIKGNDCIDGEFNMKDGRRFATYGTKWGDGEYRDQFGNRYGVDAGLIGCIRVEDIKAEKYEDYNKLGAIIEFKNDFVTSGDRPSRDWDGVIRIGELRIDTDPQFEEEYAYDDEE